MTRSRHRIPPGYVPKSDPISDRYQAEVDANTNRLDRAYRRAADRLAAAREKASAETRPARTAAAWREVEAREAELAEIERLMQPSNTASAAHRGVESFRKVPR